MRGTAILLSAFLLAGGAGAGETAPGPGRELTVKLLAAAPREGARLGYSRPRRIALERTVPRFLFEIPELGAEDPLFFRVALGQTEGLPFYGALDRSRGGLYHDRLYLDRNRDLDLTNDGPPIKARVRTLWTAEAKLIEFLDVTLDLPYRVDGKTVTQPYSCVFFFEIKEKSGPPVPDAIQVERDGWREGRVDLGGAAHRVIVIDDDSDGQFSTGDSWVLAPADRPYAELLRHGAPRTMLYPFWSGDGAFTVTVKSIDPAARSLTLQVAPAKETEREFFARIYRQRQSPEERKLGLDPLRPKVGEGEQVEWIEGKDAAYALEIAASPRVRKPVLLDFTARSCIWCARMYRYTFTDREVYELTKRFVCAKIAFKKDGPDARRYGVDGTPTYVILNPDGTEITRHAGFLRPTEFAAWLKSALR